MHCEKEAYWHQLNAESCNEPEEPQADSTSDLEDASEKKGPINQTQRSRTSRIDLVLKVGQPFENRKSILMNTNQKSYTESFRDQAVDLLLSSGRALKQVAVELGITANTLRSWRNKRIGTR